MDRHILRKIEQYTGQKLEAAVIEGFEPKRAMKMDGAPGRSGGSRGSERSNRNERSHAPGGRGGYQPRDNNRGSFGDRAAFNDAPSGRMDGEKSYGARSGGFNDRNKERTHDGPRPAGRGFSDRGFSDRTDSRPVRSVAPNRERFANRDSASTHIPRDSAGEVNGNSRSYTKDTDMQFARALSKDLGSKGFGGKSNGDRASNDRGSTRKPEGAFGARPNRTDAGRSSAPRTDSPRATSGEKFGNPRPRSNQTADRGNRSNVSAPRGGEGAPRRPRSFA